MESIFAAISNLYRWMNSPETVAAFFNNRFYTILAVVLLMRVKYAAYGSLWLTALVNIPGTILHELLHYVVGVIMNAHPCNFSIFPKKDLLGGGYVMGSVGFRNITFYNAIPASLAPLLLLPLSFLINRYVLPYIPQTLSSYVIYILLQTILIENAIPSRADFKIAFMFLSGIILYGTLLVSLLLML